MDKTQDYYVDGKGYGPLRTGIAGIVMLVVLCPMSIVAISCPYWKFFSEVQGVSTTVSTTAKASLWGVSTSTKIGGDEMQGFDDSDSELKMCGDEMQGFDDCGKIHAVRFFVITALLLSLASAICFLAVFLPYFRVECTGAELEKMTIAGKFLASVVLLWSFLGTCIAASVKMPGYSLSGAGFLSLFLQMFCCVFLLGLRLKSTSSGATEEVHIGTKQQAQATEDAPPTLLSNGRRTEHKDIEKGGAAKNVNAAVAVVVGAAEKTSYRC